MSPPGLAVLASLFALWPADAFAYLDPGTGSLIYQTLIAAALGAGIVFRRVWSRIGRSLASLVRRGPKPPSRDGAPPG